MQKYKALRNRIGVAAAARLPGVLLDGGGGPGLRSRRVTCSPAAIPETREGHAVEPGWPFAAGRTWISVTAAVEAFAEWLTAPENPLFARVAVNRVWRMAFRRGAAEGSRAISDCLAAGRRNPTLLDWLASEFVAHDYSMKRLHRLMVTSDAYQLASKAGRQVSRKVRRSTRATPTSGISACSAWPRNRSGIPSTPRRTIWT